MLILKKISRRSLFLLLCDMAAISAAFVIAIHWRYAGIYGPFWVYPFFWVAICAILIFVYIFDLYYPFKLFKPRETVLDLLYVAGLVGLILAAISYFDRSFLIARPTLIMGLLLAAIFIWHIRMVYDFLFRSRFLDKKTLIIGTGPLAQETARLIQKTPHSGMNVLGFISEKETSAAGYLNSIPIVGSLSQVSNFVRAGKVDLIVIAFDLGKAETESATIFALAKQAIVTSAIHLIEKLDEALPYQYLDEHYLLDLVSEVRMRFFLKVKRLVDVVVSLILFIVSLPILIVAMAVLSLEGVDKIFFVQKRIGRDGQPFNMYKLRSMSKTPDGRQRVTSFGRIMRKFRFDEFPQLINILKGDMSLIGPRPEIQYFVDICRQTIPFYDAVFAIRPGLTGWAQVKFLHVTEIKDYPRKFQYNLFYLKHMSVTLDVLIFLKTIRIVLLGKGK